MCVCVFFWGGGGGFLVPHLDFGSFLKSGPIFKHVSKSYNFDGNTDNIHSKVVLNSAMDTSLYMQEIPFV